jgi:hypothetical protein
MKNAFKVIMLILICTMFAGNGYSQTENAPGTSSTELPIRKKEQDALYLKLTQQKKNNLDFAIVSEEIVQKYVVLRKLGVTIPNYPKVVSIETMTIYLSQLKELIEKSSKNLSAK